MRVQNLAGLFLEIFVVAAMLVTLSSIALPRVCRMVNQDSSILAPEPVGYIAGMDLICPAEPPFNTADCYRVLFIYASSFTFDSAVTRACPLLLRAVSLYKRDF